MALPDEASQRSHSRRRSRKKRTTTVLSRLWAAWRIEILLALLLALGVFLVLERVQLRRTLLSWMQQGMQASRLLASSAVRTLVEFVRSTTLSDVVGYALVIAALALVAWRVRWRLMTTSRLTTRQCPRCNGGLHRIHRRRIDRLISVFLPVRRYVCSNHDCGWRGLRVGRVPHG